MSLGNTNEIADQLTGLRAEASARVQREKDVAKPEFVPANFWRVPSSQQFALAIDVDKSRLYVLENQNGRLIRVADFYATIGKAGGGKAREGDQRTPLGAYTLMGTIAPQKLTDFYGAGAFPLDYPNAWDKRQGRNGFGIWLHGVPSNTYSRAPRASDGCVVVSNSDLKLIEKFIHRVAHHSSLRKRSIGLIAMRRANRLRGWVSPPPSIGGPTGSTTRRALPATLRGKFRKRHPIHS